MIRLNLNPWKKDRQPNSNNTFLDNAFNIRKRNNYTVESFKSKPFWYLKNGTTDDPIEHEIEWTKQGGACCFNHMLGLPWKDAPTLENEKPIFDYEIMLAKYLNQYKQIWIKKARGLGITEFMLRYMVWLCYFSNEHQHSKFFIVAGTHQNVANEHIRRIKEMVYPFEPHVIDEKETLVTVNGCRIQAFPSRNAQDIRGYTNVKFIFIDEADFFPLKEQNEARDAAEGYILKDKPWIVMVSTPNEPGGLFETIEKLSEDQCKYKRIMLDYTVGVGKIYSELEIAIQKEQDYFEREYNLKYGYGIGNLFEQSILEKVEALGRLPQFLDFDSINHSTKKSLGIDIGYGSSRTAFVLTEHVDDLIRVIYAKDFQRPDFEAMVRLCYDLIMTYHLNNGVNRVFVDASAPSFIRAVKSVINENPNYEDILKKAKQTKFYDPIRQMTIVPVAFGVRHKQMLEHTKSLVEQERVAINPDKFPELMNDLRIARVEGLVLEKAQQNHMDLFDSLRLSLEYYK